MGSEGYIKIGKYRGFVFYRDKYGWNIHNTMQGWKLIGNTEYADILEEGSMA